jgi:hypothetical protein
MLDLSFYAALADGAWYSESEVHAGIWMWLPKYCLIAQPLSLEHINQLTEADWMSQGRLYLDTAAMLFSQLGQARVLGRNDQPEQRAIWIPRADNDQLAGIPVLLAFTLAPAQAKKAKNKALDTSQTIPPANLGEVGLILGTQGDKTGWICCPITRLSAESQQRQQHMGAALLRLASAPPKDGTAWLEQWKEIQAMARQLAADYWHAYQETQVERPRPINIWKLHQNGQASALAPLTMIQDGAHAGIYHKDKWEQEHMLEQGPHSGLKLPRYIHTSKSTQTEYWMQHPEELDAPIDPDLVSQEVLKQQTKLDDMEADLLMLAPIYLLATQQKEFYLAPEQLLKDLDFTPKQKGGYSAGYQPDELKRVIDAFERLAWLRIKTRQSIQKSRGRKPALITAEAPYLIITEWIWQEPLDESGPRRFVGWKYQITWLEKFTGGTEAGKQLGQLLKKSFAYSQKQRWEKRLARYLTIHLNVAAHDHQKGIDCNIRRVLEHCGLAPTERDKAHPDEYASQFENAMNRLKRDGIIGDWMPKIDRATLPPRAWLDLWLDSSFHVTHAPTALEAGYQKMINMRKPHQKGE